MMKRKYYLGLFVSILLISACNEQKISVQEKISRSWKYSAMQFGEDNISAERMGYPTMEFKTDSTYTVSINDMEEDGTWSIIGDSLFTTSSAGMAQKMYLSLLTFDSLIVTGLTQDNAPMTLTMVADTTKK